MCILKLKQINNLLTTQYKANPIEPLAITTSYTNGQDQPTHPKVLYFANGFNGHKYWMCYTPYPGSANSYENPCITYSDDGVNWSEEGITNPIDIPTVEKHFFSDCHLVYIESTNTLEYWYREVDNNTTLDTYRTETIVRRKSTDGINWGEKEELYSINSGMNAVLSPSIIYDEGKYKIWICYKSQCLKYFESQDGTNWQYIRDINISTTDGVYKPWHFDIIKNNDKYEFVGCYQYRGLFNKNNFIYYASSEDNITYTTPIKILSNGYEGQFDDLELYRPCLLIDGNNNYRMYYGAQKTGKIWHIGLVCFRDVQSLNNLLIGYNAVIEKMQNEINDIYKLLESGGSIIVVPVESITLSNNSYTLEVGQKLQLTATVLPSNATNKGVIWSTNNPNCTVSSLGLVTGAIEGECTITCTSNSNDSIYAICTFTITSSTASESLNLYNSSEFNDTGYYNASNGNFTENSLTGSSGKILVSPGDEIIFNGVSACYFDTNDTYVSGISYSATVPKTSIVPENAAYISFAIEKAKKFKGYLYKTPIVSTVPLNTELYNSDNAITTGYYDSANGDFIKSTSYYSTEFIKVDAGITIKQTKGNTFTFWNKNKEYLNTGGSFSSVRIPYGVDYITVSVSSSDYTSLSVIRTA